MNYEYPDRISIEDVHECEVMPLSAVLIMVLEGESTVFESEAFSKSKEIAHLLAELYKVGYSKDDITLEKISFQTSTGKILKSSTARFNIQLDNIPVDLIPKMLGLTAAQKNIEISAINYEFGKLESEKNQLLKDGCIKVKELAKEVCNSLRGLFAWDFFNVSNMDNSQ